MKNRKINTFIAAACCATAVQAGTMATNFYADFDSATAQNLLPLGASAQNAALDAGTAVGSWSVVNNPGLTFAIKENAATGNKALVYGEGTNSHGRTTWTVAQGLFASAAELSGSSATTVSFDWLRSENGLGIQGNQFAIYELFDSADQFVFGLRWGSDANDIQYATAAGTYVASGVTLLGAAKTFNDYSVAYPLMKNIVIALSNGNAVVTAGTNAAFTVALNPLRTDVSSFYLKDSNNRETGDPGAWLDNLLVSTEDGIVSPYTNGVLAVNFDPASLTNAVFVTPGALTETNDTLRVFAFSDTVPLIDGPAEYGTKIFGGMRVSATDTITGQVFNISTVYDRMQTSWSVSPSNTVTSTGLFLWNKADFINGSGSPLSFGGTPDSSLSMRFDRLNGTANYVLLDSGTYYVSDVAVAGAGIYVLNGADAVQWATWNPATLPIAPTSAYETRTFTNVQAVGFYCMATRIGDSAQMWLTGFSAMLVPETASAGYAGWASGYSLSGGALGDDDHDGLDNLSEYALGGDPTNTADQGHLPATSLRSVGGTNWFEYVYARRTDPASGLAYWLELGDSLINTNWSNSGYTELPATGTIDAGFEAVTNRIPTAAAKKYVRLRIETAE